MELCRRHRAGAGDETTGQPPLLKQFDIEAFLTRIIIEARQAAKSNGADKTAPKATEAASAGRSGALH